MGAIMASDKISSALFTKGRRELLALLFSHPDLSFYLRQIARVLGTGQGVVQRELSRLSQAGLITRTRVGSQVHYQANRQSPVFEELKSLMVKTAGLVEVLRDTLGTVADQITVAFVFGSFARGEGKANSDVDVMVVGTVAFGDVVSALQGGPKALGAGGESGGLLRGGIPGAKKIEGPFSSDSSGFTEDVFDWRRT